MVYPTSSSDIAVVVIHALGHDPDAQSEAQDEILGCRDAVDLMLGADEPCEGLLPFLIKEFHQLRLVLSDTVHRPLQL